MEGRRKKKGAEEERGGRSEGGRAEEEREGRSEGGRAEGEMESRGNIASRRRVCVCVCAGP